VLTTTRSGSTWLLTLLNGQSGVKAVGELFLWRGVRPEYAWIAEGDPERFVTRRSSLGRGRWRQIARYLDELDIFFSDAASGGFKLMTAHLRKVPELALLLLLRRYRLIVLIRDDPFASVVSEMVALATNDPHGTAAKKAAVRIELDPGELVRRVRRRRAILGALRAVRRLWPWPTAFVDYDALVRDQAAALAPVLEALDLSGPPVPVDSILKRRLTASYRDIIVNYDEVMAALRRAGLDGPKSNG
jgi:LPS sulfotransferase NodH